MAQIENNYKGRGYAKPELEDHNYVFHFFDSVPLGTEEDIEKIFIDCLGLDGVEGRLDLDSESLEAPLISRWRLDSKVFYKYDTWDCGESRRIMKAGRKVWLDLDLSKGEYEVLKHLVSKYSTDAEQYAKNYKINLNIPMLLYRLAMAKKQTPTPFNEDDDAD